MQWRLFPLWVSVVRGTYQWVSKNKKVCKLLSTLFNSSNFINQLQFALGLQKCNSILNRIFSPCNLLFQISHHQVILRFQPVKSKRMLETCVMVIGVIYEFLLVWPFIVRKKGQGHWRIFESSNLLFQRVTKIVKPVNPKKKGSRRLIHNLCQNFFFQLNSANIIIKTY